MLWLSWRQHRIELLITLALGLSLAVVMTVVMLQIQSGFAAVRQTCPSGLCASAFMNLDARFSTIVTAIEGALLALPGLAGIFIGAPLLAREFEQGTVRMVWTQGVTRRRWLATKLGLVLAAAGLVGGLLAIVGSGMSGSPAGMFTSRWSSFDLQGPALVSYVVFGIALGTAAGAIIRRSVAAMTATLVMFAVVRVAVALFVRPNFLSPLAVDEGTIGSGSNLGDSWDLGIRAVDLSGHAVSQDYYSQLAASASALPGSFSDYMRAHGVVVLYVYQPESRFWLFQSFEAALFITLAAVLIALVVWSTNRT